MNKYTSCQDKWLCPDKIGHLLGCLAISWLLIQALGIDGAFVAILFGIVVEVIEAYKARMTLEQWLYYDDTIKDLSVDIIGALLGIILAPYWNFIVWLLLAVVAMFFSGFISWEQLKNLEWQIWP